VADGQKRLAGARVAIIGCGATGSAVAALLARAGVGTLRIVDRDYVEASNLQRQTLFEESDAAESLPKAIAAARRIAAFNSQIVVEPKVADLTPSNVEGLLGETDLILDGTDNFETRYLVNGLRRKTTSALDLCRGGWQLRRHPQRHPRRDLLPGLPFPRAPVWHSRNLRNRRNPEFGCQSGRFNRGNRGAQVPCRRSRPCTQNIAVFRPVAQRPR